MDNATGIEIAWIRCQIIDSFMARRSRNSSNPAIVGTILVVLIVGFIAVAFYFQSRSEPFRTTENLPVPSYLENANSLRGNVYRLQGEVVNSLGLSPTQGRLIAISVDQDDSVVPVLIPTDFNHINIQRGQRFIFMIEVDEQGVLRARDLTKA